jgi:putative DNA primase/helicase
MNGPIQFELVAAESVANFNSVMNWLGLTGGKNQGREYMPLNPRRADTTPGSFSINRDSGAWADFACGEKGGDLISLAAYVQDVKQGEAAHRLAELLRMKLPETPTAPRHDLEAAPEAEVAPAEDVCVMPIPADAPPPPASHLRHGKPSHRWDYTAADGRVNFYHDRYEPKTEGERKQFAPITLWRSADGRLEWRFKAPPAPRPLLGLPDLAAKPGPAVLAEGEKAADAAAILLPHHPVVTWQGGSGAVSKADFSPLAGREVILWPDADEPGERAMQAVAAELRRVGAASARWLNLPALAEARGLGDLPEGFDAADLLAEGWDSERMAAFLTAEGAMLAANGPAMALDGPTARSGDAAMGTPQPDRKNAAGGVSEGWPVPHPLTAKVEPEPYPLDAMPDTIRAAVEEVAGFVKAPAALVASSALSALSLACQAHIDAKRLEKLSGPVGMFILVIADSGERKSTCDGFFTKTISDYEEAQAEAAKPILKDHKAAIEAWDAKRQGIKEKIRQLAKEQKSTAGMEGALRDLEHDKPEPPRVPRLLYADVTPEALAYGLAKQWPSGGVVSAEAGIVFGSHGMGKDSVMRNLGLLNQLWDGKSLTIDRRTSESFTVRGARLTVALQIQEPTLREFFTRSGALARGTGFLARFLVAWPESTQGMRQIDPNDPDGPATWPRLAEFHRRIAAILEQPVPIDDDGALTPAMLMLAPDAKAAWVEYHNTIESELASGGELYDVRDVASKSADNAARLAALFQQFEHGMGGAVGLDCFESASRIAAWHLHEARRFFGELALPAELADAARLDSWLIEYCQRERAHLVPIAKLQQGGPGGLRSKAAIETALRELEDANRARLVRDGKRKMIAVNPALVIEGGAS